MLFYLLTFLAPTTPIDYAVHYGTAHQEAIIWVEEHRQQLQIQASHYQLPIQELTAIIFPELLRYSEWQNLLETEALAVAYVEGGSTWADFSIGAFQMKPSFAEALEDCLKKWPRGQVTFQHLLPTPTQTIVQQRQARLDRLSSVNGQIDYLCCFYQWMQQRNGFYLVCPTPAQKIALLATAYNTGFWKSWPSLFHASQQYFFPYGAKYPQERQQAYQAVAVAYYQQTPSPPTNLFYWPFL